MRVGQALGLRHSRLRLAQAGGAHCAPGRQRQPGTGQGPLARRSAGLGPARASYSEYMHTEYGELDSDYVFVNLFAGKGRAPHGLPGRAPAHRPGQRP